MAEIHHVHEQQGSDAMLSSALLLIVLLLAVFAIAAFAFYAFQGVTPATTNPSPDVNVEGSVNLPDTPNMNVTPTPAQ